MYNLKSLQNQYIQLRFDKDLHCKEQKRHTIFQCAMVDKYKWNQCSLRYFHKYRRLSKGCCYKGWIFHKLRLHNLKYIDKLVLKKAFVEVIYYKWIKHKKIY